MFSLCKKRAAIFLIKTGIIFCIVLLSGWKRSVSDQQTIEWIHHCIAGRFNASEGTKLKKWELNISEVGFLRLRKYYPNGKQEYFSFNLSRLNTMTYLGTVGSGYIILKTKADDIIVQTYNDRKGNVDSMATSLKLPVVNMEPEQLDTLNRYLESFKQDRVE
ncbi:hypothetical protein [Arcticibacter tournemirensis]|uniref:Uncharacterized protein n=1 Tax=Arcticibacter tournemirensis TaxID=699437 RepID=A0A4Q0MDE4_9SPHI|nr:hypothetical protein [Arcticibacter tournemirensis]RXF71264.1 hypothetical protein EKH83_06130 [Arcticibacter tournemirensis]